MTTWVLKWPSLNAYYVGQNDLQQHGWTDRRREALRFDSLDAAKQARREASRSAPLAMRQVVVVKLTPRCPTKALRVDGPPGGSDEWCRCTKPKDHEGRCVCDHGFTIGEGRAS